MQVKSFVIEDFDNLTGDDYWTTNPRPIGKLYSEHAQTLQCTEKDYDPGFNTARDKTLPQNWPPEELALLPPPLRDFLERSKKTTQDQEDSPPDQLFNPAKVQIDKGQASHSTPNKNDKPLWSNIATTLRRIKIPTPNIDRVFRAVNNVNNGGRLVGSFARPPLPPVLSP